MRKTRLCIKPQPGFCSAFDIAATRKPGASQKLTENSKTDKQKSYSRPYRDGRECYSRQSPVLLELLAVAALIMTNFLSNVVTMVLFFNIGLALLSGSNPHSRSVLAAERLADFLIGSRWVRSAGFITA